MENRGAGEDLDISTVVYDSRHKVFLYFTHKGVSAYRLPPQGGGEAK
jgi:hypothetical protein